MSDVFFAPGRTELAGNHTDHQKGRVIAAAVDTGLTAHCTKNNDNVIRIRSEGFGEDEIRLRYLEVKPEEFGTTRALVRGVAAAMQDFCLDIGGFDAVVTSNLPAGSGLSSSAAFAVLMGKILNAYYNDGKLEPIVIARLAQQAENQHFGKPCGSHAGLETSYAMIPSDMTYIAGLFDKGVLSEVDPAEFRSREWDVSYRPVRRAKHFFDENDRVPKMRDALLRKDAETYMKLMNESGRSSEQYLNNIVTSATGDTKLEEGLELSAKLLEGKGAWRVHGGGFAGCVQALMPNEYFEEYKKGMEARFGGGSCQVLKI